MEKQDKTSLEKGAALIRGLVKSLPDTPGVYRMLDEGGKPLYVGKAKSLKKRVASYANAGKLPVRLKRMVAQTHEMVFVHTHTEVEALLLESNLIKKLKPYYNILMRDDKSFPYILMTGDHDYPLLTKHRGKQKRKGYYYGPFANAGAVNRAIVTLQKAFMLRNCSDNVFANRKRPCLQYQIKRCSAPCVGFVSVDGYAQQVLEAKDFLSGKSCEIQEGFARSMQEASDAQDYELAAKYRDRIKALTSIQARQDINIKNLGDADVMGIHTGTGREGGKSCVQVFFFRGGQNFGNRAYFPRHNKDDTPEDILGAFMAQFYENKPVPREVIISHEMKEKELLEQALGMKVTLPKGGARKRLVDFVIKNARDALAREVAKLASEKVLMEAVSKLFSLKNTPKRIEIYDNSHISGTNMVGGMVVAGASGFQKSAYRKFNIREALASDDYGMMREVMARRFSSAQVGGEDWPDLLLIDGGKGQLSSVTNVLEGLGIADKLTIVAIAKGEDRNAGRESFFMKGREEFQLPENDMVLHYLQRLRDEAHRFAIGAHRTRRKKDMAKSPLDDIPGVGAKRKKALLYHFGSGKAVAGAGLKDLQQVEGISKSVAEVIYNHFHEG